MTFNGFSRKDFETFHIDGLDERMEGIRSNIQPKFQALGSELVPYLSSKLGDEMYLHIAKHARRSVNPPKDTWLAISENKRGYKKHPHFQVGLFDDHLFIWLAFIYELPNKQEIAKELLSHFDTFNSLSEDFVISLDHMKKDAFPIKELEEKDLERFRDVKKAEFLIGKHLPIDNELLSNGDDLLSFIENTYEELIPFYKISKN